MFRTKYERVEKVSIPGNPIKDQLAGEYDKNKNIVVVPKGKINQYAYINSFADSVDIHVLLARFQNGDKEALLQRAGAYIDISALPTNINEFIELSRNAENLFNTLPVEVKEKFNNNVVEFISTVGDKEWIEKMNTSQAAEKVIVSDNSKKVSKKNKEASQIIYNDGVGVENESVIQDNNNLSNVNPLTGNEVK